MARKRSRKNISPAKSGAQQRAAINGAVESIEESRSRSVLVLGIFVLLFCLITVTSFLQKSPTWDEPAHLFAGYSYLKWGDFRANPEHPPLAKLLAALPLLAFDIKDPRTADAYWDLIPTGDPQNLYAFYIAARMLFVENDAETLFFFGKLPIICIAVFLGIFVYVWSKQLFGFQAAVISLLFYGLDPNILAHSQIIHTDIAFAACFFIGTYFYWRSLNDLTWLNVLLAAALFGLAVITKYSYPIMLVAWVGLGLVKIFSSQPQQCRLGNPRIFTSRWHKAAAIASVLSFALLIAYVFVWAAYDFRYAAVANGNIELPLLKELSGNGFFQHGVSFLARHHLFPEAWLYGQHFAFSHLARSTYLLGTYSSGSLSYFPVAFAVKTPLPTLIMLLAVLAIGIVKRGEKSSGFFLLIPVMVYFIFAVFSRINLGLRHILPIYPFIFVLIGGMAKDFWVGAGRIKRAGLGLMGLWYVGSSAMIFPHYLAYFNELIGGPKNGHRVLLDSNLDWGQDLKGLKSWMANNQVKTIQFLYFGTPDLAVPRYYGIDAFYLPGSSGYLPVETPPPESLKHVAISVTNLYDSPPGSGQGEFLAPFQLLKPESNVGYSILIYNVDQAIAQFGRALQANPLSAKDHQYLAILLDNQGRLAEASDHYRTALRLDPKLAHADFDQGNYSAMQAKLGSAALLYRLALEVTPDFAEGHDKLGMVLSMQGVMGESVSHFRRAVELAPTSSRMRFNLANALAREGHLEDATFHLLQAVKNRPDFVEAYVNLGKVAAAKGDLDQAISYFREALRIDPQFAQAQTNLALALAEKGRPENAAQYHREAAPPKKPRMEGF
jgi:tetratricopeptide (TPR) repeat protein